MLPLRSSVVVWFATLSTAPVKLGRVDELSCRCTAVGVVAHAATAEREIRVKTNRRMCTSVAKGNEIRLMWEKDEAGSTRVNTP